MWNGMWDGVMMTGVVEDVMSILCWYSMRIWYTVLHVGWYVGYYDAMVRDMVCWMVYGMVCGMVCYMVL